ncbi:MAG TPA: hypothetical protein VFE46_17815 [Pirellulales bacterium]|jgi:hypothetical protein|nr:hypothetical protein [Pirellulales bacterium]
MAARKTIKSWNVPKGLVTIDGKKVWKPYTEMNARELAEATAEFDQEIAESRLRPLSSEMRQRWNRFKRKRGRPIVGKGAQVISVSVEKGLLTKADQLAKKLKISRAKLISKGLETVLQHELTSNLPAQTSSRHENVRPTRFRGRPLRRLELGK